MKRRKACYGTEKKARPFGISDKAGYLFGDLANDFTFLLSSTYLMKFYTDVMGVKPAVVGIIMMVARFIDAFTDVAMGRICDRSRVTKAGKFRPWIRRMCVPVALASFLVYQSGLAGMPMGFRVGYLFVTYILWGSIFYTSINIPYGAMASAITADPGERQSLSTFRSLGGVLASVIITAGVPALVYDRIDGNQVMNGARFTLIAGIFSALAIGFYLLCYGMTTERVLPGSQNGQQQERIRKMLQKAVTNRALLSVIMASVVFLMAQLTIQSMSSYVYPNFYKNTKAQSLSSVIMLAAMLIAAAAAKPLAARFGKAEVSVAASAAAAVVSLLQFLLRPQNVWVYMGTMLAVWLSLGLFNMMTWAMITDVIDYSELKNGIREDGTVYAMYSFARKLGQAASSGFSGLLLSVIGYSEETAFDADVVNGIFHISTLVPAVSLCLLALILAFWYPLHKEQVNQNAELLKQSNAAAENKM